MASRGKPAKDRQAQSHRTVPRHPHRASEEAPAKVYPELTFDKRTPQDAQPGSEAYCLGVTVPPGTQVRITVEAIQPSGWPQVIFQQPVGGVQSAPTPSVDTGLPGELRPELQAPPAAETKRIRIPAIPTRQLRTSAVSFWRRLRDSGEKTRRTLESLALRRLVGPAGWMALSLAVYLFVRLYHLASYPIYFFTDEAVQTVLAADFVHAGFRDFLGHYFPTFFQNVYKFNLSLSVYAQVIPYLLFGKSVFITRATAVLLTVPGALAIGLTLRDIFRARYPWVGILLLSCAPAWFLHSRTAFETTLMVSFYACFLYCYLLYRTRSPKYLYPALAFAAAVFYSYSPGQIIILGTGLLLLVSDARYHWQARRTIARGVLLGILLALPYVRFRLQLSESPADVLRMLDSIWVTDAPLHEKFSTSLGYFAMGLSPAYWFLANTHDMARHVMGEHPNLMTWTLPFVLGGIAISLRRIRQTEYRALLACLLAIPLGTALVGTGITRLLSIVVPASLLIALGLDAAADWLARRLGPLVGVVIFLMLSFVSLGLLRDALVNGPLWNRNYGMDIPYGAPQVFGEVAKLIEREPADRVLVSPTWANGVDVLRRFFLPDTAPVDVGNADSFTAQRQPLDDHLVFVLTAREYEAALADPKFTDVRSEEVIPYPDGTPGFYFVRMRYSAQADAIFEQERIERLKPIVETIVVDGSPLTIEHPLFDAGRVEDLFDGDTYTLARGYEANPLVLKISFDAPRHLTGLDLTTGTMDVGVTVRLYSPDSTGPVVYAESYTGLPDDPTVSIDFAGAPARVSRVELEVQDLTQPGAAKIHLREIHFR
jgi:4-amino-4-deoxy-L-arabinose transferase-like glycosyltransferase